jgi:hypothetical protein
VHTGLFLVAGDVLQLRLLNFGQPVDGKLEHRDIALPPARAAKPL